MVAICRIIRLYVYHHSSCCNRRSHCCRPVRPYTRVLFAVIALLLIWPSVPVSLILAAAMALSLAACGKTDAPSGSQSGAVSGGKTLSMGTASLGGNFFTMGAAAASVIMDGTGLAVTAQATGGSVYNVGAVNDGELDLAMSQASAVASGYHGTDSYEGAPTENIRTLYNFNATPIHILVKKSLGASNITDLVGAKFECLTPGDGVELVTMKLLPLLGLPLDKVTLEHSGSRVQASSRMKTGQVDAILDATGCGAVWIADIYGDGSEWTLLSLTEDQIKTIVGAASKYSQMTIPANTYSGQTEDVVTVGLWTTVCCNDSMDNDTAYGIVKSVMESKDALVKAHSFYADLAPENVVDTCIAPLHPGAEKYCKEIGVL